MVNTKEYGNCGEDIAAEFLKKSGYRIIERNYRRKCGEIDIIAAKAGVCYFIEVKAKHDTGFSTPADNVNYRKRRHIADAAMIWLAENGDMLTGFLVAEVNLTTGKVELIEDFLL